LPRSSARRWTCRAHGSDEAWSQIWSHVAQNGPQDDVLGAVLPGSGGRIRTYDLWVMSPASYRAAPPRVGKRHPTRAVTGGANRGGTAQPSPARWCCRVRHQRCPPLPGQLPCRTRRTQGCRLTPRQARRDAEGHSHIPIAHLIQSTGVGRTERVTERRQAQRLESTRNLGPVF
jgi:hypothetical protein